jgi:2-desacetyl-2-hydroxyethyl bacteriochlorophyllide A dehydrogenase
MQSLWLENQILGFRKDIPAPIPARGEALVRVRLAGVCSTDLELVRGYYPFTGIPGHEFVGEVVLSPDDLSWVGKRVVGEINIACGECETCIAGFTRHCERRKTLGIRDWNGAFADYLTLPINNLHQVPDRIPDEMAVFTEPLAAAHEILEQITIRPGDRVLVVGAGRLGQLVAQVLALTGCKLDVLVRHPRQRELLINREINTITEENIPTRKYDVVVEASGSPDGFALARSTVRPRGTIVLKSTYRGNIEVNFSGMVVDEITLIGSRCGSFEPALSLMTAGKLDLIPLIEARYPLEQGTSAFEHAARPGALKVLIQPGISIVTEPGGGG